MGFVAIFGIIAGAAGLIWFIWWLCEKYFGKKENQPATSGELEPLVKKEDISPIATKEDILLLKKEIEKIRGNQELLLDGLPNAARPIQELVRDALLAEKENRPKDAIRLWKELEIRRDIGDTGLCAVYLQLANLCEELGRQEDFYRYVKKALQICISKQDEESLIFQSVCYKYLGIFYREGGELAKSLVHTKKYVEIASQILEPLKKADAFGDLALVYQDMGDFQSAIENYDKAIVIKEALKDHYGLSKDFNNISILYQMLDDYKKAVEYNRKCIVLDMRMNRPHTEFDDILPNIFEETSDKQSGIEGDLAIDIGNLGRNLVFLKKYKKAERCLLKALEFDREIGNNVGIAQDLENLGFCYLEINNLKEAKKYLDESLHLYQCIRSDGYREGIADIHDYYGDYFQKMGNLLESERCYAEATRIFIEINGNAQFVNVSIKLVRLRIINNDPASAVKAATEGIEVAEKLPYMVEKLKELKQLLAEAEAKS